MNTLATIVSVVFLAAVTESIVEYAGRDIPARLKPYFAIVISVVVCVLYQADILSLLGLVSPMPFVGSVLTGLLSARGAGWLNDFAGRWDFR